MKHWRIRFRERYEKRDRDALAFGLMTAILVVVILWASSWLSPVSSADTITISARQYRALTYQAGRARAWRRVARRSAAKVRRYECWLSPVLFRARVTSYSDGTSQCRWGTVAADTRWPLGTKLVIGSPGHYVGLFEVADRGGAVHGDTLDFATPWASEPCNGAMSWTGWGSPPVRVWKGPVPGDWRAREAARMRRARS